MKPVLLAILSALIFPAAALAAPDESGVREMPVTQKPHEIVHEPPNWRGFQVPATISLPKMVESYAIEPVTLRIPFEVNKAVISPKAQSIVAEAADMLKTNPAMTISIDGHTDATEAHSEAHNKTLSEKRAATVLRALSARGIAPHRMQTLGFGSAQPIADNTTEKGRAMNRRVEIATISRLILRRVFFKVNEAAIHPESQSIVAEAADMLKTNPAMTISIDGYADDTGSAAHNQTLAEKRAAAVFHALSAQGIEPDRMQTAAFGSTRPIADNTTATGRTINRRVEIVTIK
jgi:outer membrane protein OmpA-like peptidoglycan-associated protein